MPSAITPRRSYADIFDTRRFTMFRLRRHCLLLFAFPRRRYARRLII